MNDMVVYVVFTGSILWYVAHTLKTMWTATRPHRYEDFE